MIATYSVRLAILCFASFFLIHLALGLLSLRLSSWLARASRSMRPQGVSRISIFIRLAPAYLSMLFVMAICVPSYLRYEGNTTEEIGLLCLTLACLGFLICLIALTRAVRAIVQSTLLIQKLRTGEDSGLWHLNKEANELPSMGLVGLFKSTVVVSPSVLDTLTPEQFQAALDHEQAHRSAGDNLKRLLILLSPDMFPFTSNFRAIENLWERSAELSADDFATRGQPRRSIALAEALIKLARLEGRQTQSAPLVSGLFAAPEGLTLRVERLLQQPDPPAEIRPSFSALIWTGLCLLLVSSAFVLSQHEVSQGVYRLLESLVR
jgi:Zn-dependent protease with chaperone function